MLIKAPNYVTLWRIEKLGQTLPKAQWGLFKKTCQSLEIKTMWRETFSVSKKENGWKTRRIEYFKELNLCS